MTRYYFKKQEINEIAQDFKDEGVPFNNDFYKLNLRQQTSIIMRRLRANGYTGNTNVKKVMDYIYGDNGYLETVMQQNTVNLRDYLEGFQPEEAPARRTHEEREEIYKIDQEFMKSIRSFTNYKDVPYLELPETLTNSQVKKLNDIMTDVLTRFFKTIQSKEMYVMILTLDTATTIDGLEAYND